MYYLRNSPSTRTGHALPPLVVNFSAHTSANMLQTNLMSKFEKRKTDTYGPPLGQTFAVFIDDLNLPQRETYGAQPPLELLRGGPAWRRPGAAEPRGPFCHEGIRA